MRDWTARHWCTATLSAVAVALVLGLVTALIPNPLFTRMIETPWWSYPVWIVSAALSGLLIGTYVAPAGHPETPSTSGSTPTSETPPAKETLPTSEASAARGQRRGIGGTLLAWFAVGCPVCNKLVVLALGTSGALSWFQPVQPILALGSLALLGFALRGRLRSATRCATTPARSAAGPH